MGKSTLRKNGQTRFEIAYVSANLRLSLRMAAQQNDGHAVAVSDRMTEVLPFPANPEIRISDVKKSKTDNGSKIPT